LPRSKPQQDGFEDSPKNQALFAAKPFLLADFCRHEAAVSATPLLHNKSLGILMWGF